jgi:hypothetical protein
LTFAGEVDRIEEMVLASHQPSYIPWCGFFQKAMRADLFVLLDNVQYPRGRSWVNRNRVKGPAGVIRLTVPVKKRGRGLQSVKDVEIYSERGWSDDHLRTLRHSYGNAPYFSQLLPCFEEVYGKEWERLSDLNCRLLHHIKGLLGLSTGFALATSLGAVGAGSQLLIDICEKTGCSTYLVSRSARRYIDEGLFAERGISLRYCNAVAPIYPQLWGAFIPNLSVVDLLFNYGQKSRDVLERFTRE